MQADGVAALCLWYAAATVFCATVHAAGAAWLRDTFGCFRRVDPSHKVAYVVADVTKAVVLATFLVLPQWWRCVGATIMTADGAGWTHKSVALTIRYLVTAYAATDASQFFTVRMPASTAAHHAATAAFGLYACFTPVFPPLARALTWYGMMSCTAYLVNAYKAARVVTDAPVLRKTAFGVYIVELAINWPVHAVYILRAVHDGATPWWAIALYCGVTAVLMRDDVILLRYLSKAPPPRRAHPLGSIVVAQ